MIVLGGLVWYLGPFRSDTPVDNTPEGVAGLADATDKVNEVTAADMVNSDPVQAQTLLQGAWDDLQAAEGAVPQAQLAARSRRASRTDSRRCSARPGGGHAVLRGAGRITVSDVVMGPDDAAYAIVGDGVVRVDPTTGSVATVVQSGAGSAQGIGKPRLLSVGGPTC